MNLLLSICMMLLFFSINFKYFFQNQSYFNPKIKNAINLLDNAIVNIFLAKKSDLQSLIRNFISEPVFS